MFTGIIEATGKVSDIESRQGDSRFKIGCVDLDMSDVHIGDSIAVNGVCLTVIEFTDTTFTADVSSETIEKSGFQNYQIGEIVNLEKALLANSRLGGHLVSGHVDGIGEITHRSQDARSWRFKVKAPDAIAHYIAQKGSITIDGISLTVNSISGSEFGVNIVPHTIDSTSMGYFKVGTKVNLEVDLIARYLERLINKEQSTNAVGDGSTKAVTESLLRDNGFIS